MPILYQIAYSPWSEVASWALDWHHIDYEKRAYLPFWGAPYLRLRARHRGKLSVPVLLLASNALTDSLAIAAWADAEGTGTSLGANSSDSKEAFALANRLMGAGRILASLAVLDSRGAMQAATPSWIPKPMRPAAVRFGIRRLENKYRLVLDRTIATAEARTALNEMRLRLAKPDAPLTFATLAFAASLLQVTPPVSAGLRPAFAKALTQADIAKEFSDVIAWRDAIYARYRYP